MPPYAELHCVSNFSFLRGASHPGELVQQAKALGYSALALTDECSVAGIVRAWEAAKQAQLPLITGSEFVLKKGGKGLPPYGHAPVPSVGRQSLADDDLRLVLLAQDHDGYSEICRLITLGRRRADKGAYHLTREDFAAGAKGCQLLWVPSEQVSEADAFWIHECFGDRAHIAVELHRSGADAQRLESLHALSWRSQIPLVAAGGVHMHARARRKLQDTLTAIRHGCTLATAGYRLFPNGERHLRPIEHLRRIYPPALLEESARLASQCHFTLDQLRYEYPHELVPAGHTATSWLRQLTEQGIVRRWPGGVSAEVRALIEKELVLIAQLRYEHFFLTVQDLVAYARSRNILCQGRGSAANSAVCYCLGVTEVDPARMNLLFERFISAERNEPPDIDVDFEHERREEVIQYVYGKYGRHRAALAATLICYRPRSAIRDVGKALGFSLEQVDQLAKSIAWWDAPEALAKRQGEEMRLLIALVKELVGFPRHLSQHVGGFVISDRALSELVPVENASMPDRTVIQWDKDDLESLGLLKVDCLALGMLSAIRRSLGLIGDFRGRPMTMQDVPAEDSATYDMIGRGETTGVFQIESRAQMSMLPRLKPRNFYDLVIEVAIIRPGPIQGGMVHPYLRRRQGLETVEYPSEALKKVLERTLGVPLFQEQVMQIAMVAAGFTPGEADQVRRSMAAWKRHGGLEHFHDRLMQGMAERGYPRDFADRIYQQVLGFGSYGFPESHAASFALLTYVSCWLKCHQPAAFLAGLLNAQPMGFYAPAQLVNEARRAGVVLRPADVLHSDWDCTLECHSERECHPDRECHSERSEESLEGIPRCARDDTKPVVRLGLRMVARLPEAEAHRIVELRRAGITFADLKDLAHRARLSRRALDALADAGALRGLTGHRHDARWAANGVEMLPGLLAGSAAREKPLALPPPAEGQEIVADYRSLGLTLGRHPLALLRSKLARQHVVAANELWAVPNGKRVKVAGLVTHRQRPETASGVVFATLEDETGTANLIIWPKVMERQLEAVLGAKLMLVEGELQSEQGVIHVIAREIRDCSGWLGGLRAPSRDFH